MIQKPPGFLHSMNCEDILREAKDFGKHLDCIRCGVCCASGPCQVGKSMPDADACQYLILNKEGIASCTLLLDGKAKPIDVGINGSGCTIRKLSMVYEWDRRKLLALKEELIEKGERRKNV